MAQGFGVRVSNLGPNRVRVLAIIHPLSGITPEQFREKIDNGPVIAVQDIRRDAAVKLASTLTSLGAEAQVFVSTDDC